MSSHVFKKGRSGSTFKPSGGLSARPAARPSPEPQRPPSPPRPDAAADERRDRRRLEEEIRRAENLAAGLPEDASHEPEPEYTAAGRDQSFRRPIDEDEDDNRRRQPRDDARDEDDRDARARDDDDRDRGAEDDEGRPDRDDRERGLEQGRRGGGRGRRSRRRGRGGDASPEPSRDDESTRGERRADRASDKDDDRREERPRSVPERAKGPTREPAHRTREVVEPERKVSKEVIINAEPLESRVAVLEDGRLEEFTVERTNDARLVGSIYKGKVKNLEDNLKAAFVDIGFEKNAFLHYWDIIPNTFDSSVEIVERDDGAKSRRKDKPKITQKDVPRLFPPGSEIIVQVTKGPIGTKGPRVTKIGRAHV